MLSCSDIDDYDLGAKVRHKENQFMNKYFITEAVVDKFVETHYKNHSVKLYLKKYTIYEIIPKTTRLISQNRPSTVSSCRNGCFISNHSLLLQTQRILPNSSLHS